MLGTSLLELSDLVAWSGGFDVRSADGKCGGSGGRMDLLGRDVQAAGALNVGIQILDSVGDQILTDISK